MKELGVLDCLIIGGGPAGLVAATYLARYHRHVEIMDSGDSRASHVSESNNVPGFANGISGPDLLIKLKRQAESAGVVLTKGHIDKLSFENGHFYAFTDAQSVVAKTVLLATGCKDLPVEINLPSRYTWEKIIRWCPVCDGFESTDKKIVIISENADGPAHARFLRSYTRDLTLVARSDKCEIASADKEMLKKIGVKLIETAPVKATFKAGGGRLQFTDGSSIAFDVLYPMAGSRGNSQLAMDLHLNCDVDGSIKTYSGQTTDFSGLYAAGDLVSTLKQISVAMAEGALAATAIHHYLPPNFR